MAEHHDTTEPQGHDHTHDHHDHGEVDCEAALAEIYTYLDGELTEEKRQLIAGHLEGCNPCIEAFDFEAELRMVVSTKCRNDEVPEALRVRIFQKLTLIARGDDPEGGDEGARGLRA
jgi:mycothiol system anti-sigma-R factor